MKVTDYQKSYIPIKRPDNPSDKQVHRKTYIWPYCKIPYMKSAINLLSDLSFLLSDL
jgi:hypothetical protein